jgi:hypothetical protein
MPCEVGRIRPWTFSSRSFEDVVLWLPDHRSTTPIFTCKQAIWEEHGSGEDEVNQLYLDAGTLNLGTDGWDAADYRQVLQSGLGHDFEDLNLSRVELTNFEMSFTRGTVAIRCRDTSGTLLMNGADDGTGRLVAYELNGHRVTQGVQIDARFSPTHGVQVHELFLELPEVPLSKIGVSAALGSTVTRGTFAGGVQYVGTEEEPAVWLRGNLSDADLAELTARLPFGPIVGHASVNVEAARLAGSVVTHLRGRGQIRGVALNSFARLIGQEGLDGTAEFNIQWVDLALGQIGELVLDGAVRSLSLEQLLRFWGKGSAAGTLAIQVNGLRIVKDRIESADIEVHALPPAGRAGTIDRSLLLGAAEKALSFTWPDWLPQRLIPEKVEYEQFGMRLLVRDNKLRVLGTHGTDRSTILTVRVLGQSLGLVNEQPGEIDLGPWIEQALKRAREYDPQRMRDYLRRS